MPANRGNTSLNLYETPLGSLLGLAKMLACNEIRLFDEVVSPPLLNLTINCIRSINMSSAPNAAIARSDAKSACSLHPLTC
jgi:hypothetical protein